VLTAWFLCGEVVRKGKRAPGPRQVLYPLAAPGQSLGLIYASEKR
jgi:hypothetical protein